MTKLNKGHLHEAIDRIHVIQSNIETHLQEHPVFDKSINKNGSEKLNKVQILLGELYQKIGATITHSTPPTE